MVNAALLAVVGAQSRRTGTAANVRRAVDVSAAGVGLDDSEEDQSDEMDEMDERVLTGGLEVLALNLARKLLPTNASGAQFAACDAQPARPVPPVPTANPTSQCGGQGFESPQLHQDFRAL